MLSNILKTIKIKLKFGNIFKDSPLQYRGLKYMHFGKGTSIEKNSRIECFDSFYGVHYNPSLIFGEDVHIGFNFTALVIDKLVIGSHTLIASNVTIVDFNHGMDPEKSYPYHVQPLKGRSVYIGENVWIGQNVCILPGVSIGNNCIIAAGSIVHTGCDNDCILAGNPARVIKKYDYVAHKWIRSAV